MTRFAKLQAAFPSFPMATLPAIPPAWVDASWPGRAFADACPQFIAAGTDNGVRVVVVINWEDRCGCGDDYVATVYDEEDGMIDEIGSNDWRKIVDKVAQWAVYKCLPLYMKEREAIDAMRAAEMAARKPCPDLLQALAEYEATLNAGGILSPEDSNFLFRFMMGWPE